MNGTTLLKSVDFGPMPLTWTVAGIGDFDGNGSFDLLWRDTAGDVAIWSWHAPAVAVEIACYRCCRPRECRQVAHSDVSCCLRLPRQSAWFKGKSRIRECPDAELLSPRNPDIQLQTHCVSGSEVCKTSFRSQGKSVDTVYFLQSGVTYRHRVWFSPGCSPLG